MQKIRVTVWNEFIDEKRRPVVRDTYPEGIHEAIASFLREDGRFEVRTSTLDEPDAGLSDPLLDGTDVLLWWGHVAHHAVPDGRVDRVLARINEGMGFIALHSGFYSKPMVRMVGPRMTGAYREDGEKERVWVVNPAHPICEGLTDRIEIPHSEMYAEPNGVAAPDELLFISWYPGGEVFRSGGVWYRGRGRVFGFTPGHEEYPIYRQPEIQRVIRNAAAWAYNPPSGYVYRKGAVEPLEPIRPEQE